MGELRFYYPTKRLSAALVRRAFISAHGRRPMPTSIKTRVYNERLSLLAVSYASTEPASLYLPCRDHRDGFYFASTGVLLPDSQHIYSLFFELARGQLARILQRFTLWQGFGMRAPHAVASGIASARARFLEMLTKYRGANNYDELAYELFYDFQDLSRRLNEFFLNLSLRVRTSPGATRDISFAFSAPAGVKWTEPYDAVFMPRRGKRRPKLTRAFTTFNPQFRWRDLQDDYGNIDWTPLDLALRHAQSRDLDVTIGPLIRWGERLPGDLNYGAVDSKRLEQEYLRYLYQLIDCEDSRATRWIVATNIETSEPSPSLETRVALAARTAMILRERRPHAQIYLGFEQAFGDANRYFAPPRRDPFELAALVARRDLFTGFYLEVNLGMNSWTCAPRDPMETHAFFDKWSMLGVPLSVAFSCPSQTPLQELLSDAKTRCVDNRDAETHKSKIRSVFPSAHERQHGVEDVLEELLWTQQQQLETTRLFYTSALTRHTVEQIIWTRWVDQPQEELQQEEPASWSHELDSEKTQRVSQLEVIYSDNPHESEDVDFPEEEIELELIDDQYDDDLHETDSQRDAATHVWEEQAYKDRVYRDQYVYQSVEAYEDATEQVELANQNDVAASVTDACAIVDSTSHVESASQPQSDAQDESTDFELTDAAYLGRGTKQPLSSETYAPTSGLFGYDLKPKPALHKIVALRRSCFD